jgi:hypothetical protein
MVRVLFTEEEVNYLVAVLNQFLKTQPDAISASKDVVYMVNKLKAGEKMDTQKELGTEETEVE